MSISVPDVSAQQVASLVRDINEKGFACLPNFIPPADLKRMQDFVASEVAKAGNEYVGYSGVERVAGSGLDDLAHSDKFEKLIHDVYEGGTGKSASKEPLYQVLRCLSGHTAKKNSYIFHYDSYIVTALVPIQIPSSGLAGDLLMYPNTRRIRSSYFANAIDKVLLDNPVTQWLLKQVVNSKRFGPMKVKMLPGNLYFFWGYRTIHTNEACDPDKVRATALFHYANQHRPLPAKAPEPARSPVQVAN